MTPPTVDEVVCARRSYKVAVEASLESDIGYYWEEIDQRFPALLHLIARAEDQAFAELVRVEIERCRK